MIPGSSDTLKSDFKFEELPTRTYKLNTENKTIGGYVDKSEAMKQAIYIILNVERYQHIIHSWNFGIELSDLFGKPVSFVLPSLERRIREALLQDTRVKSVEDFRFEVKKGVVSATFVVKTIFGDIPAEKAVNI